MAILNQHHIDEIKKKYKFQTDRYLSEIDNIPKRVDDLRLNRIKNKFDTAFQQNEFAYLIGVQPQNYTRMKKGKKGGGMDIALPYLIKTAVFFEKSLDFVVMGKEDVVPAPVVHDNSKEIVEQMKMTIDSQKYALDICKQQNEHKDKELQGKDDEIRRLKDQLNEFINKNKQ